MSFVLKPIESITRTLEFTPPGADEACTLEVEFSYLGNKARQTLIRELDANNRAYQNALEAYNQADNKAELAHPEPDITDQTLAERLTVNIHGLLTPDGEAITYQPTHLNAVLDMDYVSVPYYREMYRLIYGDTIAKVLEKKRIAAGQHWANPPPDPEHTARQLAQWGANADDINAVRASAAPPFELYTPNAAAFRLFAACRPEYGHRGEHGGGPALLHRHQPHGTGRRDAYARHKKETPAPVTGRSTANRTWRAGRRQSAPAVTAITGLAARATRPTARHGTRLPAPITGTTHSGIAPPANRTTPFISSNIAGAAARQNTISTLSTQLWQKPINRAWY